MRYWSIILHFYQPGTQDPHITESVCRTCYLPLLRMLKGKREIGLSVNISGSLLLQLQKIGASEFFELVGDLVREGKLEILTSPIHHPLVPIAPREIVERQLVRSRELVLKTMWSEAVRGVYMPELGVDEESLRYIGSQADFVVADETCCGSSGIVKWEDINLVVNNRDICEMVRSTPNRLEAEKLVNYVNTSIGDGELVVSVHDAELFGHHYEERLELLTGMLDDGSIRFIKASEAVKQFGEGAERIKKLKASTWQITNEFELWNGNKLQKKYLNLGLEAWDVFNSVELKTDEKTREVATDHLDQGWSSCHLYWLSNSPWWHPDLVERGANCLIRCIRTLPVEFSQKAQAESLYHEFLEKMWLYHWSGEVEEGYKKYEVVRQKLLDALPNLG